MIKESDWNERYHRPRRRRRRRGCLTRLVTTVLVLGLLHPYTAQEGPEGRRRSVEQVKEFQRRFTQQFHLLNCRELLAEHGLHPTLTAQAVGADDHCGTLIVSAVELLCDYLAELDQK